MAGKTPSIINRRLEAENEELRARLAESEDALRALASGEVDAFVVYDPAGPRIFTLQGAEHAYRVIMETMNEGAVTTTLDGTILYGNKALTRMLGISLPSIMGRPLRELVFKNSLRRFQKMMELARSGPARERLVLRAAGNGAMAAYFSTALLPRKEGEPQICMVLTDLTELEAASAQLQASREREKVLAASEESFRLFAEAVPNIAWTTDPEGAVEYYNQRWTEFSGLPTSAGHKWGWDVILHPDDREATVAAWRQAVAGGGFYQVEHRLRRADGKYRWHLSRAVPLRDENNRISKWYGTSTDIDDQKRNAEALLKLTEQLSRSNEELEEFAYIASHDLQEPLRVVTGFLDLLRRRYHGRLDRNADEFIDFAVDGATRMQNLIRDLLAYSRVGTRMEEFGPVDSGRIVDQAMANLKVSIEEAGARIVRTDLPVVVAVETMLTQLFQNLISNALKFRSPEPPDIRIAAEARKEEWLFSVQDRGIGLEPRQAERIFKIFQRLHPVDKYRGTGIGLAICKKILDRHGGRIWVESQPGQGATFYFTLPRKQHEGKKA